MLNTLDIVIAFAVIMTVLSLLITILVQMVSAALALRGKNLANALSITFQTIDPNIAAQANSLAAQILRDPIFSDSIWRKKTREALPVVNAATQAVIEAERILKAAELALARNRDETRKEGLDTAMKTAKAKVAEAKAKPGVIKREVDPNREKPWSVWMPFGSAMHLGSAIRPGEIYRSLHEFCELTETEAALRNIPPKLIKTATSLVEELRKTDQPALESRGKLAVIRQVSEFFTNEQQQLAVVNALGNFGATVERATTQAYDRFQRWFGSGQDRAEQWFQSHIRVVTIVMANLMAFVLQLDTIQIYGQLRDRPKLVEALVKSAPDVLKQGETILNPANTSAYHAYLLWLQKHPLFPLKTLPPSGKLSDYKQALAERLKQKPDPDYPLQQFDKVFELTRKTAGFSDNTDAAAAKPAYDEWVRQFPMFKLDPEPDFATATKESLRAAIKDKIAKDPEATNSPDEETTKKWLENYDSLQTEGTFAFERSRSATFTDLTKKLEEASFDLAPPRLFGRWDGEPLPNWLSGCPFFGHFLVHILGVLMTAGLLTLGAPFWFNLLKNLMNLRPAVASLIEKRPNSAPALPATPATPSPS